MRVNGAISSVAFKHNPIYCRMCLYRRSSSPRVWERSSGRIRYMSLSSNLFFLPRCRRGVSQLKHRKQEEVRQSRDSGTPTRFSKTSSHRKKNKKNTAKLFCLTPTLLPQVSMHFIPKALCYPNWEPVLNHIQQ